MIQKKTPDYKKTIYPENLVPLRGKEYEKF
jgi:hypothetical protein